MTMNITTEVRRISLPRVGKIGVTLHGSPPTVTNIQPTSPMMGQLNIGDVIDGLCIPNKLTVEHIDEAHTLTTLLQQTSQLFPRSLLVLPPNNGYVTTTNHDTTKETEYHVTIPKGKLGITFEGDHQPTVAKVWDYCPVREFVHEGYWIKSILIPGEPEIVCSPLSARNVYEVLRTRSRYEGRVLVLTNPPIAVAEPVSHHHATTSSEPLYKPTPSTTTRAGPLLSSSTATTSSSHHDGMSVGSGHSAPLSTSTTTTASTNTHSTSAPHQPHCSTMDVSIEDSLVTFQLRQGQGVRADHDNMVYMTPGFHVKKRGMKVSQFAKGYPLGMTEFIYEGGHHDDSDSTAAAGRRMGTVAFAPVSGHKILTLQLENYGGVILCQAASYICSETSVNVYIETCPPSSEGGILLRLVGTGCVWLSGSNRIIKKRLKRGESIKCSTTAVVAFEKSVQYFTHRVRGGLKSIIGGNECYWTELTGPGCAWLQASVADHAPMFQPSSSVDRTNRPSSNGFAPRQTRAGQERRAEI